MRQSAHGKRWAGPVLGVALGLLVVSGYPGVVLLSPLWFGRMGRLAPVDLLRRPGLRQAFLVRNGPQPRAGRGNFLRVLAAIATNLTAFSRGEPLSTDAALVQSLLPADLWHLAFRSRRPVAGRAAADLSMRGLYFGIVALVLALYASWPAEADRHVLGVAFLAALLMSMGKNFFVRVALHDFLPLFNFSRFPAADSRAVAALADVCSLGPVGDLLEDAAGRDRLARSSWGGPVVLSVGLLWLGLHLSQRDPRPAARKIRKVVIFEMFLVTSRWLVCCAFLDPMPYRITSRFAGPRLWHPRGESDLIGPCPRAREASSIARGTGAALSIPPTRWCPGLTSSSLIDPRSNDGYLNKRFISPLLTRPYLAEEHRDHSRPASFCNFLINGKRVVGFTFTEGPPQSGAALRAEGPAGYRLQDRAVLAGPR